MGGRGGALWLVSGWQVGHHYSAGRVAASCLRPVVLQPSLLLPLTPPSPHSSSSPPIKQNMDKLSEEMRKTQAELAEERKKASAAQKTADQVWGPVCMEGAEGVWGEWVLAHAAFASDHLPL